MSMWTNDLIYGGERLDQHVTIGDNPLTAEKVLLLDCAILSDAVPTSLGDATKTNLLITKLDDSYKPVGDPIVVGTLAKSIADKVRSKADGDLPAIVVFFTVGTKYESDATVMQFVARYDGKVPAFKPLTEGVPF